ncbi:MAG: SPOR domain-containing protein, partial [Crocinitomicaceae bacterium]|nr:SPOR domain-containing protein [Crocinitomicaceae bacterium]
MEIKALIAELLYQTNCLVLPRFGGFIANQLPAKYDDQLRQFQPPSRVFNFNANVTNNDGFLIHALANKLGVPYQDAEKRVHAFLLEVKFDLDQGKRVTLDSVGFLVKNKDGFIIFEQDRFLNLLRSSYGLGQVRFIEEENDLVQKALNPSTQKKSEIKDKNNSFVQETNEQLEINSPSSSNAENQDVNKALALEKDNTAKPNISIKKHLTVVAEHKNQKDIILKAPASNGYQVLKKIAKIAAVAALLPMAFYSFWIPMKTNFLESKVLYLEDFNPFQSNSDKAAIYFRDSLHDVNAVSIEKDPTFSLLMGQLNEGKTSFVFPITEDKYYHVKNLANSQIEESGRPIVNSEKSLSVKNKKPVSKSKGFHLIAGCFSDVKNAEKLVADLKSKGYEAFIVDQNKGLHRVSAAFSESRK